MKVIIAGSRSIADYAQVNLAMMACEYEATEVVCGGAKGADWLGHRWAYVNGIPVQFFPSDWTKWGRSAGMIRNVEMAKYADALVALWDGKSKGTKHMIEQMRKRGKPVYVHLVAVDDKGNQNDVRSGSDSEGSARPAGVCAGGVER